MSITDEDIEQWRAMAAEVGQEWDNSNPWHGATQRHLARAVLALISEREGPEPKQPPEPEYTDDGEAVFAMLLGLSNE